MIFSQKFLRRCLPYIPGRHRAYIFKTGQHAVQAITGHRPTARQRIAQLSFQRTLIAYRQFTIGSDDLFIEIADKNLAYAAMLSS